MSNTIQLALIKSLHDLVVTSVMRTDGNLSYQDVIKTSISMIDKVAEYEGDNDDLWAIGEHSECSMADIIPALYWHCTEWQDGRGSDIDRLLSVAGTVFEPNMVEGPEEGTQEQDFYNQINVMAEL